MRVLFASVPAVGHFFPLASLAWAFRSAGHDVLFASYDDAARIGTTGLQWVDAAPGVVMYQEALGVAGAAHPAELARVRHTMGADREAFVVLFAHVNNVVADGMVAAARAWRPDLVVYEYMSPVGLVIAGALGVPAVQFGIGFTATGPLLEVMLPHLGEAFARHGVSRPPMPLDIVHTVAPSMTGGEHGGLPVRPVPLNGGGLLPAWLATPPRRPRVAVTLGTVSAAMSGVDRIRRVVAAAREVDAEFVLAMGPEETAELGELPPNVRAAGWVPWDALMTTCAAAVHHGGSGTTMTALHAGVPQLLLPDGSDRHINAAAAGGRGAALTAAAADVTPDLLNRVLEDDKLRATAAEVSAELTRMPAPAELAANLA
jgi:UDP:flavonoid glycosyltransferase YjiC (YdhE family)